MNLAQSALLAALATAGISTAHAQDTIIIAPEQQTIIREYVVEHPGTAVEVPGDYELGVGTVIPSDVTLVPVDVPEVTYDYVVIDGRTAIVDRGSRRVIEIYD